MFFVPVVHSVSFMFFSFFSSCSPCWVRWRRRSGWLGCTHSTGSQTAGVKYIVLMQRSFNNMRGIDAFCFESIDWIERLWNIESHLVVVGLTVGKAFPLVVAVSHERLLALQIKFVHHLLLKIAFIQMKIAFIQTKLRQECLPWRRRSARRTNVSQVRWPPSPRSDV